MGMGYMELRGKARAWLMSAKDSSVVTRQAAENDRLQAEIELLKTQIAELATPKRGRPAKEVAEA
jgi:cell division protein FtsB